MYDKFIIFYDIFKKIHIYQQGSLKVQKFHKEETRISAYNNVNEYKIDFRRKTGELLTCYLVLHYKKTNLFK